MFGALRKILGLHVNQPQQQHLSGVAPGQSPQPTSNSITTPNGDTLRTAPQWSPQSTNLGASDNQVQGSEPGFSPVYQQSLQGIQGGQYNPGFNPLQDNNPVRYRQGPQPAQPWYDF